jgi:hypothetical protein
MIKQKIEEIEKNSEEMEHERREKFMKIFKGDLKHIKKIKKDLERLLNTLGGLPLYLSIYIEGNINGRIESGRSANSHLMTFWDALSLEIIHLESNIDMIKKKIQEDKCTKN